jgi:hypothetical protein
VSGGSGSRRGVGHARGQGVERIDGGDERLPQGRGAVGRRRGRSRGERLLDGAGGAFSAGLAQRYGDPLERCPSRRRLGFQRRRLRIDAIPQVLEDVHHRVQPPSRGARLQVRKHFVAQRLHAAVDEAFGGDHHDPIEPRFVHPDTLPDAGRIGSLVVGRGRGRSRSEIKRRPPSILAWHCPSHR